MNENRCKEERVDFSTEYKSQMRFIQPYKNNTIYTNIAKIDMVKKYITLVNKYVRRMQPKTTTWPHFSSLWGSVRLIAAVHSTETWGILWSVSPMCQDRQSFTACLERQAFAFELATYSTQTEHEDFCHIFSEKRGSGGYIHCSSNEGVTPICVLGNMLLSLTSAESKIDIWEGMSTFLRQLIALSTLFKWLWLSKAVVFLK